MWQIGAALLLLAGCHAAAHGSTRQAAIASFRTDSASATYTFEEYKTAFARTYAADSEEYSMRKRLFDERAAHVSSHNSQPHSWKLGINHLTDRTDEELRWLFGYKRQLAASRQESLLAKSSGSSCASQQQACDGSKPGCCKDLVCGAQGRCEEPKSLPKHIDWTPMLPGSTSLLDQGGCGSCWAIAATAAIQMQAALNSNGTFAKMLSPQGMLGCTPNPKKCGGTGGCDGATPELGFTWAKKYGIQYLKKQGYTAQNGCPKEFLEAVPIVRIAGYVRLPENKGKHLMKSLVTVGPVSIAAAAQEWMPYQSGVFDGCDGNTVVNHAVVLFGYGQEEEKLYWKIRNSWGESWGENGFIRLRRHGPEGKEPCGWDTKPEVGVGCEGGPKKLWVCGECGVLSDSAYPVGAQVDIGPL